jgi:hypothetical protein
MRNAYANSWFVIYAFGIATYTRPLVLVPAALAALAAITVFRWTEDLTDHGYAGALRALHQVIVGAVLAIALVGLGAAATATATASFELEPSLRHPLLAAFFLVTAIFAWRALVHPHPRRVAAIATFVYLGWLPFLAIDLVIREALGALPARDTRGMIVQISLWLLLGAGGLACWLATQARRAEIPAARVR